MNNIHILLLDASCYESWIRFPTDIKILWESCQWIYEKQIFHLCKVLSIRRPRSKYIDQKKKQRKYEHNRKKTYKQGIKRKKALIYLLEKGIGQLQDILNQNPRLRLKASHYENLRIIKKVLTQQTFLLTHKPKELNKRIVSLSRPYIRPIVRGKENKRVEFGMKVHMMQVDGVCIIDKVSFDAFNESKRLRFSVLKHKSLFGQCHQLGADKIYASNPNRRYLTDEKIFTCFSRKGVNIDRPQEKKLRSLLSTARSTIMEGSFGTHKQHYGLGKIKARGEKREILWVFFGVMTANAVLMSKRLALEKQVKQAA